MLNPEQNFGTYLREQREKKGLSIDEAARETNIAKRYIEALERSEFGVFPAEMYVLGFLTSYIEVLEMDKELVLSLYRRAVSKEQEMPLEELYHFQSSNEKRNKNVIILMIAVPITLLFLILSVLLFRNQGSENIQKTNANQETILQADQIELSNLILQNEFEAQVKSKIGIMRNGVLQNTLQFLGHGKANNQIVFQLGQDRYTYRDGDILSADLDKDGANDLSIEIIKVGKNTVKFVLTSKDDVTSQDSTGNFSFANYEKSVLNQVPIAVLNGTTKIDGTIATTRPTWIEYSSDNQPVQKQYLIGGQSINFSFNDGLVVLIGNAGAVTVSFKGFTETVRGGTAGETSYSVFYKKMDRGEMKLFRAQLR